MRAADRTVLHVLPHPGGGGDTYVDLLQAMPDYRFSRVYLAGSPMASPLRALRGAAWTILHGRRFDLVHVHGEVAAGLCLPLLAMRPSVVTLHGLHLVRRLHGVRRGAAVMSLRAVLRAVDRTICVSEAERAELQRLVGGAASRRAVVIRNGVRIPEPSTSVERAEVRSELGIAMDETVAIWVGSLDERKDPLTAVRAANCARVTLLVVGDGPLRLEVERAAGPNVLVLGPRGDVPRLLGAADVYVATSHREGLSLSLLEAMAAGLAPIVTDLPENVEAVGTTGIALSVTDEVALIRAIDELAWRGDEREMRGRAARDRASTVFDVVGMTAATHATYDNVSAR